MPGPIIKLRVPQKTPLSQLPMVNPDLSNPSTPNHSTPNTFTPNMPKPPIASTPSSTSPTTLQTCQKCKHAGEMAMTFRNDKVKAEKGRDDMKKGWIADHNKLEATIKELSGYKALAEQAKASAEKCKEEFAKCGRVHTEGSIPCSELESKVVDVSTLTKEISRNKTEIGALNTTVLELKQKLDRRDHTLRMLQNEMKTLEIGLRQAEQTARTAREDLAIVYTKEKRIVTRKVDLCNENYVLANNLGFAEGELEEMEAEKAKLQKMLKKEMEKNGKGKGKSSTSARVDEELQKELMSVRSKLEAMTATKDKYKDEFMSLRSEMQSQLVKNPDLAIVEAMQVVALGGDVEKLEKERGDGEWEDTPVNPVSEVIQVVASGEEVEKLEEERDDANTGATMSAARVEDLKRQLAFATNNRITDDIPKKESDAIKTEATAPASQVKIPEKQISTTHAACLTCCVIEQELETAKHEATSTATKISILEKELILANDAIAAFETLDEELETDKPAVTTLSTQVETLEKQASTPEDPCPTCPVLKEELEIAKAEVVSSATKISDLEKELISANDASDRYETSKQDFDTAKSETTSSATKISDLEKQLLAVKETSNALETLKQELDIAKADVSISSNKISNLQKQLLAASDKNTTRQTTITALKTAAATAAEDISTLELERDAANAQAETASTSLEDAESELRAANASNVDLEARIGVLTRKVHSAEAAAKIHKKAKDASCDDRFEYGKKITGLQEDIRVLKMERAHGGPTWKKYNALKAENFDLEIKLRAAKTRAEKKEWEAERGLFKNWNGLVARNAALAAQKQALESRVMGFVAEAEEQKVALADMELRCLGACVTIELQTTAQWRPQPAPKPVTKWTKIKKTLTWILVVLVFVGLSIANCMYNPNAGRPMGVVPWTSPFVAPTQVLPLCENFAATTSPMPTMVVSPPVVTETPVPTHANHFNPLTHIPTSETYNLGSNDDYTLSSTSGPYAYEDAQRLARRQSTHTPSRLNLTTLGFDAILKHWISLDAQGKKYYTKEHVPWVKITESEYWDEEEVREAAAERVRYEKTWAAKMQKAVVEYPEMAVAAALVVFGYGHSFGQGWGLWGAGVEEGLWRMVGVTVAWSRV